MPFSLLRNRDTSPFTLPFPLSGIVAPGKSKIFPISSSDLIAALGGTGALSGNIAVEALPDTYAGSFDPTAADSYPVGATILAKTAPSSLYKKANGQALSQVLYPELFSLIGIQPSFTPTPKTIIPTSLIDVAYSASLGLYVGIASSNPGIYISTDLVQWNACNTAGIGATPTAIAYCSGLGMFVVLAGNGSAYTSIDGFNWVRQNVYPDTTLSFVACSPSLIVVAGASNLDNSILNIWSSADGVTWTKRNLAGTAAITVTALHYSAGLTLFLLGGSAGAIQTSPDGITWTSRTSNFGANQINQFASSGALVVAVGAAGVIVSSPDGITWTARTYQTARALSGVAYSAIATIPWIAVGAFVIMTSTDGITWITLEEIYLGASSIGWDGAQYVSVGSTGSIQTTPDLLTWTARVSSQPTISFNSVAFGAGVWVMVGASGKINSSADGITWTTRTSGTANALNHVIFVASGINLFVAVGVSNTILTSPDGITWTARTATGGFSAVAAKTTGGDLLVAIGGSGVIVTSPDGVTWTSRTSTTQRSLGGVAWNGTIFCAVGNSGTTLTSTDGVTWTKRTPTGLPNATPVCVVSDGTRFYTFVFGIGAVYQSTDGIVWQGYSCPVEMLGLVFINSRLVAYAQFGDIATSTDGKVWTLPANSRGLGTLNKCYWFSAAGKFLVTGSTMGGYLSSTDGRIFRGFNAGISGGNIAYSEDQELHVIAAGGYALLTSDDGGDTWTPNYAFSNATTSQSFNDVAYSEELGLFIAVGVNCLIVSSPDGVTWTQRFVTIAGFGTAPSAHTLVSVVWSADKTLFVATGAFGVIATSPDGINWTQRDSGVGVNLGQVCYNSALGMFAVISANGLILTSTNGTAWTKRNTGTSPQTFLAISSLEANGFVATGLQSQTYHSPDGVTWTLQRGFGTASLAGKSCYGPVDASVFVPVGGSSNGSSGFVYSTNDGLTQEQHGMNSSGTNGPNALGIDYDSTEDAYLVTMSSGTPSSLWVCKLQRSYDKDTEFVLPKLPNTYVKVL